MIGIQRATPFVRDLFAIAIYWVTALGVLSRLWAWPRGRTVSANGADQIFFEWLLAHAARSVTRLENPLFSTRMNVPDGVNMMANTSALGITVPLVPVTLAFGPAVSYALWVTAALALTATTWYLFFRYGLRLGRLAAFVGGAFCGFAPGMIAHLHGQPNISTQFVVPLILWQVMRLARPGPLVRDGVVLGLLITYQAFVNEEILFVTAWVCAVVAAGYAALHRPEAVRVARKFAAGLGVAAAVAAVLLAYPLWFQFFGPAHYRGLPPEFQNHVADLGSYPAYSAESLGGLQSPTRFSLTIVENNSFFGWPLLAAVALIVWWFRRELAVRLAAIVAALFGVLSLGAQLRYSRRPTGIPGPWSLLDSIPPFSMVVPTRLALVVTAAIGVLLAVSLDRAWAASGRSGDRSGSWRGVRRAEPERSEEPTALPRMPNYRLMWAGALAAILLPLVPTRLDVVPRQPTPAFFTGGAWRAYVGPDQAVVPLPVPTGRNVSLAGMTWAADTKLAFRIPHGYFLGPEPGRQDRRARLGSSPTSFSATVAAAEKESRVREVTPELRTELVRDLRRWNAAILVLPRGYRRAEVIRATVERFAGPAKAVDDVWLWDVRALVASR